MRSRTTTWIDPRASAAAHEGLSGLAWLEAIVAGRIPQPPISATLDFVIVEARHGFAAFEGTPGEHVLNPMGSVHGGYACTLLDSALGSAVMSVLDAGTAYGTVQIGVHLVRPIGVETGRVRCEARIVHRGRALATASGELVDREGRVLAHGTTTCALFPRARS
ncbi:PaaI family thioesterase [Sandaracinus amylolyticus]|nr:PaaI family thioesterase [Sandaracinus amylolyticus]